MLLRGAKRNGVELPVETEAELQDFMQFRDFDHFIEAWFATIPALRTEQDFRELVLDYATRAVAQGAAYVEGIFSPCDHLLLADVDLDTCFTGFCDGAQAAREATGLEIRLTPDITRGVDQELANRVAHAAVRYRDRGVVGLGLGGDEARYPPEQYAAAFAIAREGGVGSVPHAGEVAGPASIRGAVDALAADRIRHGVRAVEDPELTAELAERGIVCDVCVVSNIRLGVFPTVEGHPLPALLAAGVPCTVNTDDPSFFDVDLEREHAAASGLGADPRALYDAGVRGALCDGETRARLAVIGAAYDWEALAA